MADRGSEFRSFQGVHVRIDTKIDTSISIRPMTIKLGKQAHLRELSQLRLTKQVLVTSSRQGHLAN